MSYGVVIPSQQKHASLGDMGSLFLLLPGHKNEVGRQPQKQNTGSLLSFFLAKKTKRGDKPSKQTTSQL